MSGGFCTRVRQKRILFLNLFGTAARHRNLTELPDSFDRQRGEDENDDIWEHCELGATKGVLA